MPNDLEMAKCLNGSSLFALAAAGTHSVSKFSLLASQSALQVHLKNQGVAIVPFVPPAAFSQRAEGPIYISMGQRSM